MSLTRKIAHNTLIQIAGKAFGLFFSVLTLGLITRYLGPELFGYYTTIFAFLQIFGILIDFGLQMSTVQLISDPREDEGRMLSNIFTLRLISALIFFLAPLAAIFFPYPPVVKTGIVITSFSYFFTTISTVLVGIFQKQLAMWRVALADFINKFFLCIVVFVAVYFEKSILWILGFTAASNALYFFLVYFSAKKLTRIHLLFEKEKWLLIMRRSWPIALSIALNLIYFKADTIILSLSRSQNEVGLYGAPYKILEVLINLSYLFLALLLPLMTAAYAEKNLERFKNIVQRGFDAMVILGVPLVLGTALLGEKIMGLIAGEEFIESGSILRVIILATATIFLASVFGYAIVAINKQKQMIPFYLVNAVVSLALYIVFIPKYGYWAAAWVTVLSEAWILVSAFYVLKKNAGFIPDTSIASKAFMSAVCMCIPILVSMRFGWLNEASTIPVVFISALVYGLALYAFRGISKDTLREIIKIKN